MKQLEFEIESDEEKEKRQEKKIRLYELFRSGDEASWLKFLNTPKAKEILDE